MDFTPIAQVGEFGLIDRLNDLLGPTLDETVLRSIGDDAAVYRVHGDRVHVVTTDALIENVHFDRVFHPLRYLGAKALTVNVSDVVAMNARPRYATIALGLPSNVSVEQIEEVYTGLREAAARYGVTLVGGDVTAARQMVLSITVIGEAAEHEVVYRSGAQPGDLLCVSGDLGAGYAGLKVLMDEKDTFATPDAPQPDLSGFAHIVQRVLYPLARLDLVHLWAEKGVRPTALIDLSDGLASEVHHLCRASNTGAVVDVGLLPVHRQTFEAAARFDEGADQYALYGGDDYELLFTMSAADLETLDPSTYAVIGQMTDPEEGIHVRLPDGGTMPLEAAGFSHF